MTKLEAKVEALKNINQFLTSELEYIKRHPGTEWFTYHKYETIQTRLMFEITEIVFGPA